MVNEISWKVGGQQGEGIESTGEIFSTGLNRLGYYLYGYRQFSSRIKGGHTNNKIRISTSQVKTITDMLDILVAFDQETIDLNYHELHEKGIILADEKFKPKCPDDYKGNFFSVPFSQIAADLGSTMMKNMVAIGATCAAINLHIHSFSEVIEEVFSRKGASIVASNIEALEKGKKFLQGVIKNEEIINLAKATDSKKLFMIGNEAIALGALAGGARLMFAYPITPASEIMEFLIKKLPKFGGTVIQTEDEIAACTMAIGANYAGVRAFTASAGPGLSLMMESIGLSGMTETPLVIVDTQRGGPSTGLPTKQEQSDIFAAIYGNHGDIPKVVIAPSTVEEAFYDTVEAFNIAEQYQLPVILLCDLQLSLGKQSVLPFDLSKVNIHRGNLITNHEILPSLPNKKYFKRYEVTDNGISPRVIPGMKHGIHHVTGVEHDETGKPVEQALNRKQQMEKRMKKLNNFSIKLPFIENIQNNLAEILFIGVNSTRGVIEEVVERLRVNNWKVNHIHIRQLFPFPTTLLAPFVEKAEHIIVVEQNATGQLTNLLKMNIGYHEKFRTILKYDGNPFLPEELYSECAKRLETLGYASKNS